MREGFLHPSWSCSTCTLAVSPAPMQGPIQTVDNDNMHNDNSSDMYIYIYIIMQQIGDVCVYIHIDRSIHLSIYLSVYV